MLISILSCCTVPWLGDFASGSGLRAMRPAGDFVAQIGTSLPKLGLRYGAPGRRLPCPDWDFVAVRLAGDFVAQAGTLVERNASKMRFDYGTSSSRREQGS